MLQSGLDSALLSHRAGLAVALAGTRAPFRLGDNQYLCAEAFCAISTPRLFPYRIRLTPIATAPVRALDAQLYPGFESPNAQAIWATTSQGARSFIRPYFPHQHWPPVADLNILLLLVLKWSDNHMTSPATTEGLEKERDFYFPKLEALEAEGQDDLTLRDIQKIIYSTEEGFGDPEGRRRRTDRGRRDRTNEAYAKSFVQCQPAKSPAFKPSGTKRPNQRAGEIWASKPDEDIPAFEPSTSKIPPLPSCGINGINEKRKRKRKRGIASESLVPVGRRTSVSRSDAVTQTYAMYICRPMQRGFESAASCRSTLQTSFTGKYTAVLIHRCLDKGYRKLKSEFGLQPGSDAGCAPCTHFPPQLPWYPVDKPSVIQISSSPLSTYSVKMAFNLATGPEVTKSIVLYRTYSVNAGLPDQDGRKGY
ncbi:hypothetical protein B0H11DRAFT_2307735 [Mycena galericulata]|nr:hypothetical protein B0H11DRAFT_2307735 [Mycena galericulata]